MEVISTQNEKLEIVTGGLYSPFPIPAFRILVAANEHIAKDILLCLVSHLGLSNRMAYPSYTTIANETGRSRGSVSKGIRTLEDLGFVKKFQFRKENKKYNKYYLQDCCWNHDRMTAGALEYSPVVGRCGCGQTVRNGEVGLGLTSFHHWGCGDKVKMFSSRSNAFDIRD